MHTGDTIAHPTSTCPVSFEAGRQFLTPTHDIPEAPLPPFGHPLLGDYKKNLATALVSLPSLPMSY